MLKIRLQRVGRKHEPVFRVVLTDSKNSTKSGRVREVLGSYDPRKTVDLLKTDRIKYWLGYGALPSGTVHNLFVTHKIIDSKKINVLPRKRPIPKEVVAEEVKENINIKKTISDEIKVAPIKEESAPTEEAVVESTEPQS